MIKHGDKLCDWFNEVRCTLHLFNPLLLSCASLCPVLILLFDVSCLADHD